MDVVQLSKGKLLLMIVPYHPAGVSFIFIKSISIVPTYLLKHFLTFTFFILGLVLDRLYEISTSYISIHFCMLIILK